ncbi:polyketide cyclase / dehydrase and lipid transport [Methyloglobulus sp.]|uniref:polyketide cyclase / dehydrase and lipid transport n=1 Tax=Methyloglobulus sp. TaxID=2518622 RepID=UPI0039891947
MDFRPEFSLTTTWSIPASIGLTWLYLVDTEKWPLWWKYVVSVQEVADGSPTGIDNVRQYHWHTCLPYSLLLKLRVTEVLPYRRLAVEVTGDLLGSGSCNLSWNSSSEHTKIEFIWQVQPCKHWMNWFTILTKPIFIWNHNRVMQQGEQGLIRHLSAIKQTH